MIHPVIMAGGRGERFWPYSNSKHPKQLLPLVTERSMLEDTLANLRAFDPKAKIRLIISQNLEAPVKAKLRGIKGIEIIAEPMGRNTAAAVALAARMIAQEDPEGVMLVLTADHAISPPAKFKQAMKAAVTVAKQGKSLVTFGIRPDRPEVGYGYIETDVTQGHANDLPVYSVKAFHEKPSAKKAAEYLASGRFFWNSGMFAWRVDTLWGQFQKHQPELASAFEKAGDLKLHNPKFKNRLKNLYKALPDLSIDYGIMEKADAIEVVIPTFNWDDIGSWSSLDRLNTADEAGNRRLGDVIALETEGTTLFTDAGLVCTFGVKDLLVVQHEGVTLVVHKDKVPRIKEIVKLVQSNRKIHKYL